MPEVFYIILLEFETPLARIKLFTLLITKRITKWLNWEYKSQSSRVALFVLIKKIFEEKWLHEDGWTSYVHGVKDRAGIVKNLDARWL